MYTDALSGKWAVDKENLDQIVQMYGGNRSKLESFYLIKKSVYIDG